MCRAPTRWRISVKLPYFAAATLAAALSALVLTPSAATAAPAAPAATASTVAGQKALPPYSTWIADVTAVTTQAAGYLSTRLPAPAIKPAIVLDIDNTALEAYYSPGLTVPATKPVLAVAQQAKASGAAIFFVTARPEFLRWWTESNLTSVGYKADGVYLKNGFVADQAQKTAARTDIEKRGYTIVANIGNNDTDLAGGHAERTFKLPDYDGQLG
jgi:hypothetical protein